MGERKREKRISMINFENADNNLAKIVLIPPDSGD